MTTSNSLSGRPSDVQVLHLPDALFLKETVMTECCGSERTTSFCPDCGKRIEGEFEEIKPIVKSGVVFKLPKKATNTFGVSSASGLVDVVAMLDEETDSIEIKVRFWGEHPSLEVVPEGCCYPEAESRMIAELIEETILTEKERNVRDSEENKQA